MLALCFMVLQTQTIKSTLTGEHYFVYIYTFEWNIAFFVKVFMKIKGERREENLLL